MADASALSITVRCDSIVSRFTCPSICHSMLLLPWKSREVLTSNSSATLGNCPTMNYLEISCLLGRQHLFFVPCLITVSVSVLSEMMEQNFRISEEEIML